jgi:two-component system cell cycle response regulator
MMVSAEPNRFQHWMMQLRSEIPAKISHGTLADVLSDVQGAATPDVFVLIMPADPGTSSATLRLIATLRANASTRHAGILLLQTTPDAALAANALDLGADELMTDGFDAPELALRLSALMHRKRKDAQLRATIRSEANAAGHDTLTGLHNRRYALPHLSQVAAHASATGRPLAVMVADLDHFKQVNDAFGHASGDAVLVEVANRLRNSLRASDMVARIGGEEFLIIMPGTTPTTARETALRICQNVGDTPFDVPGHPTPIRVTISIGLALGGNPEPGQSRTKQAGSDLLDRADKALYSAKMRGRNRVTLSRPAA